MDARPSFSRGGFETCHAQNGNQMIANSCPTVITVILIVPEQASVKAARHVGLLPRFEKRAQRIYRALRQRQEAGLEELRFPDRDGPRLHVNVAKRQPCNLANSQSGAIG